VEPLAPPTLDQKTLHLLALLQGLNQPPSVRVVGFLNSGSPYAARDSAFRAGLATTGYIEGQNVTVDFHWAEGRYAELPALAAELVRRQVTVIFAGGPPAARAAKAASSTIPIVFTTGDDPIKDGLIASLNRPGGNATGINLIAAELEAKRLGLLHELIPAAVLIGVLLNPKNPNFETQLRDVQSAARTIAQVELLNASSRNEIEAAFTTLVSRRAGAISVGSDPFFFAQINQLVELAARHSIPAIYEWREFVAAGGLLSYGVSLAGAYREASIYVGRILKGEKPADLPVLQPTKFELVINLKTAKALGIEVPPTLLARVDEVIE
jgi:putative tryptophan/tyrosine transport system substrate-binding protein